jgi:hypothetical protein
MHGEANGRCHASSLLKLKQMSDTLTPLVLDLLEWIAAKPRPYTEVMDAWRTSCPKLTVWEEANDRRFVTQRRANGSEAMVELTPHGRTFLESSGRITLPQR